MLLDLMASGRSFMQRARSRDLKLSPTDCHGLMLGFTALSLILKEIVKGSLWLFFSGGYW